LGKRPVAQRVERIGDAFVEQIGHSDEAMRGVVAIGERRAVRQRHRDQVTRRIVSERRGEHARRSGHRAAEQPLAGIVGEIGDHPIGVDDRLGQASRQVLGYLRLLPKGIRYLRERPGAVIGELRYILEGSSA
jgi:hypothetical protein